MEEDRALRRSSSSSASGGAFSHSVLRYPAVGTTFTIPLTRYATPLISADRHRALFADCADPRPDPEQQQQQHRHDDDGGGGGDDDHFNCAYSFPILVLDVVWNLAFVLVSVFVLFSTFRERPSTPLRLWVSGYALQCLLHVGFVFFQYHHGFDDPFALRSIMKRLESMNTMTSSVWWVFGFYWIVMGGHALLQDSPRLYWLTVVFLAFDLFFILFCIGMACVVFFSLCCCIPIVAFAYAMTTREGASEEDIGTLPKYTFRQAPVLGTFNRGKEREPVGARLEFDNKHHIKELALHPEDSECCICLSQYEDGTELYSLPCNHHFHCGCISKWLRINATCPLCKSNIRRGDTLV